jgi:hypothetical protein
MHPANDPFRVLPEFAYLKGHLEPKIAGWLTDERACKFLDQQPFRGIALEGIRRRRQPLQSIIGEMALATHPITAAERARRTCVYEEARASVRLEGFELDEQVEALYQRYMSGELTLAEVGSAIDDLDDREFGPVSLSRHKRP